MKQKIIIIFQVVLFVIIFAIATGTYASEYDIDMKHIHFTNTGYGVKIDADAFQENPAYLELEHYAFTIWCEARGDGYAGMLMVADVIKNRVKSKLFPNTYIEVIHQKNDEKAKHGQFSCWTGKYGLQVDESQIVDEDKINAIDRKAYQTAFKIAYDKMTNGGKYPHLTIALWYHTKSIKPYWSKHYEKIGMIGEHVLYIAKKL